MALVSVVREKHGEQLQGAFEELDEWLEDWFNVPA